jgi:hypothetical protein
MPTQEEDIIIGFDLDGVIIDHTQNKMRIAARYGVMLQPEETHAEFMKRSFTPEIYREIKTQLYDETDEALAAPLMEGSFSALARLHERNIPYYLVSLQKNPMHALHLLELRGLWGKYFMPENTFFVEHMEDKNTLAQSLGVTHFIDDEREVLKLMPDVSNRILFDARGLFEKSADFVPVKNWSELGYLLGIATN